MEPGRTTPLRIIVDVNLLIGFLIGKQLVGFLQLLRNDEFVLFISAPMLAELVDVAAQPTFLPHVPVELAHQLALTLADLGDLVTVEAGSSEPLSGDPKDDYLLLMAEKANADVLVTGDADLLLLENFGATRILSALSFTKEFIN